MIGGGSTAGPWGSGTDGDRRAASEVVGVVLLFGLVLIGVVLIALSGGSAVDQVQQQSEYSSAQVSMQELKTDLTTVIQDSSREQTSFQMGNERTDDMRILDDGVMNFSVNGDRSCFFASRDLGSVEYNSSDGRRVAYQANAVFSMDGEHVEMVSVPGLAYRETTNENGFTVRTISFELANVDPNSSRVQGGDITARPSRDARDMNLLECERDVDGDGLQETDRVDWVNNITVEVAHNDFYRGWAGFFREEFGEALGSGGDGDLDVYDANRTVRVTVPLGIAHDDDNDGVPDRDSRTAPIGSAAYPGSTADNCPPPPGVEAPPNASIRANYTNYDQLDSDGDGEGDVCDDTPYGGGGGGGGTGVSNDPPSLRASPNATEVVVTSSAEVGIDASASAGTSDPDDAVSSLSFSWSTSGPGHVVDSTTATPVYVPPDPTAISSDQLVTITGTVTDPDGNTDTREVHLVLRDSAGGGSVDVPPNTILTNETSLVVDEGGSNVVLNASASWDPDGGSVSLSWSTPSCSGSDCGSLGPGSGVRNYQPPADVDGYEIVTVSVTATDDEGSSSSDSIRLLVLDRDNSGASPPSFNAPPTAVATADDRIVLAGGSEPLNGSLSRDADGDPLDYTWSIVDGPGGGTITNEHSERPTYQAPNSISTSDAVRIRLEVDDGTETSDDVLVLSAFNGSSVTDSDGDGIPDSEDDCPSYNGTGVNGCQPISEEGNSLRVNQSGGTITYVDSMLAHMNDSAEIRLPIDVTFVLDASGSMGRHGHNLRLEGSGGGSVTVPEDHEYQVMATDFEIERSPGVYEVPPGQTWTATGSAEETVTVSETRAYTVPAGEIWVVPNDQIGTMGDTAAFEIPYEHDLWEFWPDDEDDDGDGTPNDYTDEEWLTVTADSDGAYNLDYLDIDTDLDGEAEQTYGTFYFEEGDTFAVRWNDGYHADGSNGQQFEGPSEAGHDDGIIPMFENVMLNVVLDRYDRDGVTRFGPGSTVTLFRGMEYTVYEEATYEAGETVDLSGKTGNTTIQVNWRDPDDDGTDAGDPDYPDWLGNEDAPDQEDPGVDRTFEPGDTLYVFPEMTCGIGVKDCTNDNGNDPRDLLEVDDIGNDPLFERVDATHSFLGVLNTSAGDRVSAIAFDNSGSDIDGMDLTGDFEYVRSVVDNDSVSPGGGTLLHAGMDEALDEYEDDSSNDRVMVVLTDGLIDSSNSEMNTQIEDAIDEDVTVYAVGLSKAADREGLSEIANETGGEYYQVRNAEDLVDTYETIAGDAITERVKRIEHRAVNGSVNVGNSRRITIGSGPFVHDPTDPGTTYENLSFEPGSLLSLDATAYECSGYVDTGEDWNGDYNVTTCNTGNPLWSVDNSTSNHVIFTDGEDAPGPASPLNSMDPWETNFSDVVNNYAPGTIDGGEFNLAPDEAFFAMQMPNESFVVLHFEANDTPTDDHCTEGADCLDANDTPPKAIGLADDGVVNASETEALDASQSYDPGDGSIVSYSWSVTSGPGGIDGSGETVSYDAPDSPPSSPTTVEVELTVTDNNGSTDSTTIKLGLAGDGGSLPNAAPEASVTADDGVVEAGDGEPLDASGSFDPDGSIANYNWTLENGTGTLDTSGPDSAAEYEPDPSLTGSAEVTVVIEVTDDDGATDAKVIKFVETESSPTINRPPTAIADADDHEVDAGGTEGLDGSASFDSDGSVSSYSWSISSCGVPSGCGSFVSTGGTTASGATVDYQAPPDADLAGNVVVNVTLTVTDDGGESSTDVVRIGVNASGSSGSGGSGGDDPDNGYVIGIGGGEITIGDPDDD